MPARSYEEQKERFTLFACYGFFALFMGLALVFAGVEAHHSYQLYAHGAVGQGQVTRAYTDEEGVRIYEVAFRTPDGRRYVVENHFHTMDDLYRSGDAAPVVYLPTAPADGRIDNPREKYGVVLGCLLIALAGGLMATVFYVKLHRPMRAARAAGRG